MGSREWWLARRLPYLMSMVVAVGAVEIVPRSQIEF
jgi:hypothetical protein